MEWRDSWDLQADRVEHLVEPAHIVVEKVHMQCTVQVVDPLQLHQHCMDLLVSITSCCIVNLGDCRQENCILRLQVLGGLSTLILGGGQFEVECQDIGWEAVRTEELVDWKICEE